MTQEHNKAMWEWHQNANECNRWYQSRLLRSSVIFFKEFEGGEHLKENGLKWFATQHIGCGGTQGQEEVQNQKGEHMSWRN